MSDKSSQYLGYSADVDVFMPTSDVGACILQCQEQELGKCCVFNPQSKSIDEQVSEYSNATALVLPRIDANAPWSVDGLIDAYEDKFGTEETAKLLYLFTNGGGGLGYTLESASHWLSAWDIDHARKAVFIDEDEVFSSRTNAEAADTLRALIAREFEGKKTFWDNAWRVAKGAGITVLGVGEIAVGVVGIIVPEPGTTVAGIAVTAFGVATTTEGITQMLNLNEGKGYNPIEEGFALVGDWTGGNDGESLARVAFVFTNIVVSLGGSYKVLKVIPPNGSFIFKGTYTGVGFSKYYKEGFSIGRLQLLYEMQGGKVIINVTNNSNQWIFRFQQFASAKQIVLNGRIIGVNTWHRVSSPKEMIKILAKLAIHGFGK